MKLWNYTKNQPLNLDAYKFGEACMVAAADMNSGDLIDRGLILLRELESRGYGIVKIEVTTDKG